MRVIQHPNIPNTIQKTRETKENLYQLKALIAKYVPEKSKFVLNKIKAEQK